MSLLDLTVSNPTRALPDLYPQTLLSSQTNDVAAWENRLRGIDADYVCVGHTHVPMHLRWRTTRICNPGSTSTGRCARGPTCAVLRLPDMLLEVHALERDAGPELLDCSDALA